MATWIVGKKGEDLTPIVVYGHKSPFMLVCFLACVKAGRAYCPVDLSMPHERIAAIIKKVGNDIAFATEEIPCEVEEAKLVDFISTNEINEIIDIVKSLDTYNLKSIVILFVFYNFALC